MAIEIPLLAFMAETGGNTNANGDYSVTPGSFRITAAADQVVHIYRILITVRDTAATADRYGNIAGGLTNGVKLYHRSAADALLFDATPEPVKTNTGWGEYCYDVDLKTWGSGDVVLLVRWTAPRAFGKPFTLRPGEYIEVYLSDDLTGLVEHKFHVQGLIYDQDPGS